MMFVFRASRFVPRATGFVRRASCFVLRAMRRLRNAKHEGGSVLMEYVVVNLAIAVPLLLMWHLEIYDFATNKWVGEFGLGLQAMFQRVLNGIALPIP